MKEESFVPTFLECSGWFILHQGSAWSSLYILPIVWEERFLFLLSLGAKAWRTEKSCSVNTLHLGGNERKVLFLSFFSLGSILDARAKAITAHSSCCHLNTPLLLYSHSGNSFLPVTSYIISLSQTDHPPENSPSSFRWFIYLVTNIQVIHS